METSKIENSRPLLTPFTPLGLLLLGEVEGVMAFVCTLDGTLPEIAFSGGPLPSVLAPIGYDDVEPLTFFALTALGKSGGGLVDFFVKL